jgi:hypothetical protein
MEEHHGAAGNGSDTAPEKPNPPTTEEPTQPDSEGLASSIVSHLQAAAEPVANVVGPMASALGSAIEAAGQAIPSPADIADRIHRAVSPEPVANLYELFPEARDASPRELGLRFVPVEEIRGTAVAGHAQRGTDFLPLRPYRGGNWQARFQRITDANERLQPLPPIDLVKYGGDFWVVDGHNRVGAALQDNAAGLDAMVTELVPLDGQVSERPTQLLAMMGESQEMQAAAQGRRPAMGLRYAELASSEEPEPDAESADPRGTPA